MLTDLDIKHRIEIPLVGGGAATTTFPLTDLGSPEFPWQLKNISGITIAGPAIQIVSIGVHDENGNLIYNAGLLPWVFAATTQLISTQQDLDVPSIVFIGPAVIVGLPADFYVYSDWELRVNLLNPVGATFDLTATFMEGFFRDKYRLSA